MPPTGTPPVTIAELLSEANVRLGVEAPDKPMLIAQLVETLSISDGGVDLEAVTEAVLERESLLSTGVGYGVGLPHAKTALLDETHVVFATTARPIEFDSFDGEPVRLVFLIVGPMRASGRHIQLLGRISRILNNESVRQALISASSVQEVIQVFESAESALIAA